MLRKPRNSWANSDRPAALALVVAALVSAATTGCQSRPAGTPELAPVTGTVRLGGKPLAGAVVQFEASGGQVAMGHTDADGRYTISYTGALPGAPLGKNVVRITSKLDAPPGAGYVDPVQAQYNTRSKLSAEVVKGPNTFDFDLAPSR